MTCMEAHPERGEEVAVMDDVGVTICKGSVSGIFDLEERMGKE